MNCRAKIAVQWDRATECVLIAAKTGGMRVDGLYMLILGFLATPKPSVTDRMPGLDRFQSDPTQ